MKQIAILIFAAGVLLSCKKNKEENERVLTGIEARDYMGGVTRISFRYDQQGRILSITHQKDNAAPYTKLNASYSGSEVSISFYPVSVGADQVYYRNIRFSLAPDGRPLSRFGSSRRVSENAVIPLPDETGNDTALYSYDPAGFLKSLHVSGLSFYPVSADSTVLSYFVTDQQFANDGVNLTTSETNSRLLWMRRGVSGVPVITSGVTVEAHDRYGYTKAYPNTLDYKNSALLNEYWSDMSFFKATQCIANKYLADDWDQTWVERDLSGNLLNQYHFHAADIYEYNASGLLSRITKQAGSANYVEIHFYYGN